jgi:hypothetical protein
MPLSPSHFVYRFHHSLTQALTAAVNQSLAHEAYDALATASQLERETQQLMADAAQTVPLVLLLLCVVMRGHRDESQNCGGPNVG